MTRSLVFAVAVTAVAASLITAVPAAATPTASVVGGTVFEWRDPKNIYTPAAPASTQEGVTAVATDGVTSLAVKDGRVIVWSNAPYPDEDSAAMNTLTGVTDVAVLGDTRYAIVNGRVVTWGRQLEYPLPAFTQSGIVEMTHSRNHFVFRNSDGEVQVWMPFKRPSTRTAVPEVARTGADAIAAGYQTSAVIKNGEVIVWHQGSASLREVPDVAKSGVIALHTAGVYGGFSEQYGFAVAKSDGSVWAWGYDPIDKRLNTPERLAINDTVVKIDDYLGNLIGLTAAGKMVVLKHVVTDRPFGLFPAARSGVIAFAAQYTHLIVVRDSTLPPPDPTVTMKECQLNQGKRQRLPLLVCRGSATQVPEGARVEMAAYVSPGEFRLRAVEGVSGVVRADGTFVIKTRNFDAIFRGAPQQWRRLVLTGCYFDEYQWDWCPRKPANITRPATRP